MTGPWKIVEGIAGMWRYHLAPIDGGDSTALCGAQTMLTHCLLKSWGFKPKHIPTSYCEKCEKLAKQQMEKL